MAAPCRPRILRRSKSAIRFASTRPAAGYLRNAGDEDAQGNEPILGSKMGKQTPRPRVGTRRAHPALGDREQALHSNDRSDQTDDLAGCGTASAPRHGLDRVKRGIIALGLLLTSCGGAQSSPANPAPVSSASSSAACLDNDAVTSLTNQVHAHLLKVVKDLKTLNLDDAVAQLRVAASDTRSTADLVTPLDEVTAGKLLRTADDMDHAADAFNKFDISNASSYIGQATEDLKNSIDGIQALYC
jgi:hypothetical protein